MSGHCEMVHSLHFSDSCSKEALLGCCNSVEYQFYESFGVGGFIYRIKGVFVFILCVDNLAPSRKKQTYSDKGSSNLRFK